MGVERFFSSIYNQFNIIKNIQKPYPIYKTDHLLIDFNSIIHTITSTSKIKSYKTINIFEEIKKYLINLFSIVKANNVYIAIDGVPSMAKMLEQKKRRYLADIINSIVEERLSLENQTKKESFEKILISPATKFMEELVLLLKQIKIENVNIKISDFNEEGEGEMKIIRYIKYNNLDNVFVYSPDSDMILLLSMLELKNIILFRHDQKNSYIDEEGIYQYVYNYLDVNSFKKVLIDYIKSKKIINFDNQKIINDIIYIFNLFGNDFLPKVESLKIESDLFILIDSYLLYYLNHKTYILDNNKNLFKFLEILSKLEYIFINRNIMDYFYVNYDINFRNKFIYEVRNNKFYNLQLYHYQMLKYIDWNKILKNPLDYLILDLKILQQYLINYVKKFDYNIFLGDLSKTNFKIELKNKTQSIKDKYHQQKTSSYSLENKIRYQIEYKLDDYSKIFNTNDIFYETLNKYKYPYDNYSDIYNKIYHIQPLQIQKYLEGWIWIKEYYFNNSYSNLFSYFYHKAPLLKDIVSFYNSGHFNTNIVYDYYEIKPLHLLLYITPFKNNKEDIIKRLSKLGIDESFYKLILNNKNFIFLQGDKDKNSLDCTSSIFTSKCHYMPLNNEINIREFIQSIPINFSKSRKTSTASRKSRKTGTK